MADVRNPDRGPVLGRDDDVVEIRRGVHAPERAEQQLSLPLFDGPARNLDVLGDDGVADLVIESPYEFSFSRSTTM